MRLPTRLFGAVLLAAAMPVPAMAQAHPDLNDGGTLPWFKTLAEAEAAAKKADKLIFIEFGRPT